MGLANFVDQVGTKLGLPEYGISEYLAGNRPTTNTGVSNQSRSAGYTNYTPSNFSPNVPTNIYGGGGTYTTGAASRATTTGGNQGQVLGTGTTTGLSSLITGGQPQTDVFGDAGNAAQSQNNSEIQSLNTQFDRLRSEAESQIPFLQQERARSLSNLANELTGLQTSIGTQKEQSQQNTDSQIAEAGQVARDTQRSNRNTLRALGILNSSAAGELLSKPLNQFDKVRAGIVQEGTRRINELDNFLNQKTSEHANMVADIEANYSQLIGQIQNDLRFNERERADAIRSANAALQQRIAEIQQAQFNWKTQIDTVKAQLAGELGQLNSYTAPTADTSGISSLVPNLQAQAQPQTVGLVADEKDKKGLSSVI